MPRREVHVVQSGLQFRGTMRITADGDGQFVVVALQQAAGLFHRSPGNPDQVIRFAGLPCTPHVTARGTVS